MKKSEIYANYLIEQGYKPQIYKDGDIVFKKEDSFYLITCCENDPGYFCIMYPNFWPTDNEKEMRLLPIAANKVNRDIKIVKIIVNEECTNVMAEVGLLFDEPEQFKDVFERVMSMFISSVQLFQQEIVSLQNQN